MGPAAGTGVRRLYDDEVDAIRPYVDGRPAAGTAYSCATKTAGTLRTGRAATADGRGGHTGGRVGGVRARTGAPARTWFARPADGAMEVRRAGGGCAGACSGPVTVEFRP